MIFYDYFVQIPVYRVDSCSLLVKNLHDSIPIVNRGNFYASYLSDNPFHEPLHSDSASTTVV